MCTTPTASTLTALGAAVDAGFVPADAADLLRAAWLLSSRLRSAITLYTGKTSDVLPTDPRDLDAIGRLLGYPDRSASVLDDDYLGVTRRARRAFEQLFYG
jgi:glutamate-ammonia-ligase adenylyltransferase